MPGLFASSTRRTNSAPTIEQRGSVLEERPFPWLELALGVSGLALFFQVFPSVWWSAVSTTTLISSYLDVRQWTWRSYAVVCGLTIAVLIVIKGRADNT